MIRRNKYRAVRTQYNGRWFASKAEARYAAQLDMQRKAVDPRERVTDVKYQPRFPLPAGITYVADFLVAYADGRTEVVDVKGFETKEFKLKKKLFEQTYPELKLMVVR